MYVNPYGGGWEQANELTFQTINRYHLPHIISFRSSINVYRLTQDCSKCLISNEIIGSPQIQPCLLPRRSHLSCFDVILMFCTGYEK